MRAVELVRKPVVRTLGAVLSGFASALICGTAFAWTPVWQPDSNAQSGYISMELMSQDGYKRDGGWWYQLESDSNQDWFAEQGLYGQSGGEIARSTLSFDQQYKTHTFHWGVSQADGDQLNQLGISLGKSTLYGFSGNGDTTARIANPLEDIGSFHFHGGIRQQYDYSGFRYDYRINGVNTFGFTHAKIKAPALDDRNVYDLSWQGRTINASFMQVNVGGELAGQVLGFGKQFGRNSVSLQGMRAANEATYASLTFASRTRNGKALSMKLEQRRNPLYEDANEDRITFGLAFKFGGAPKLYATDTPADGQTEEEAAAETARKQRTTGMLIGAGAIGGALALSSGSSTSDDNRRLDQQHEAGRAGLNAVNPMSIEQNREWGGWIFRNADGTYSPGDPVQGTNDSLQLPPTARILPNGAEVSASYHTHAAYDPRYDNENFSPTDINTSRVNSIDGYLGTPAGQFKFYNHVTDEISTLGGPGTLAM